MARGGDPGAPGTAAATGALGLLDQLSQVRAMLAARAWAGALTAAGVGAALSLIQAPASAWPLLLLIAPLPALLWLDAPSPRRAAVIGGSFGLGYFIPGLAWIGSAFLVEADQFAWLMPFAVTLLPALLSLFWAGAFASAAWARDRSRARDAETTLWVGLALLVAAFGAAEWLRGHVLTGFPWGLFGYAWVETPVAQWAAWIGPYGLTLVSFGLVAGAAGGLDALLAGRRATALRAGGAVVAVLLTMWSAGWARTPSGPVPRDGPLFRLVQPNVPQTEKWARPYVQRNFNWLLDLSRPRGGTRPEVVVWPETAVPFFADQRPDLRQYVMAQTEAPLLVLGSQRFEAVWAEPRWYNSLFALGPDGGVIGLYDKHHLVPFGEFLPFQELLQSFGIRQLAGRSTGFSSGPGPQTLRLPGTPSFAALICYEAVFPEEMPHGTERPDLLLQVTNDAWFGESGGPHQHLAQARMRAIEQGLPFLRSANTGISAGIDPYGRVEASAALGERGVVDIQPAAPLPPTLYAVAGDALFWLLAAALGLGAAAAGRRADVTSPD